MLKHRCTRARSASRASLGSQCHRHLGPSRAPRSASRRGGPRVSPIPVPRHSCSRRAPRPVRARLPEVRSLRRLPCGHDHDGSPSGRRLGLQPPVFERVHRCLGWSRQQRSICSICSICSIVVSPYVLHAAECKGYGILALGPVSQRFVVMYVLRLTPTPASGIVRTPFQSGSRRGLHSGPGPRFSHANAMRRLPARSEPPPPPKRTRGRSESSPEALGPRAPRWILPTTADPPLAIAPWLAIRTVHESVRVLSMGETTKSFGNWY